VRSAFDLLLGALALPPGSEVLMSALNVKGMIRIVRAHGLVPVPVDLEPGDLAPSPAALERAITPSSRMLVAAHLFGARYELDPLLAVARRHGLLVVEDCAQAFAPGFTGHPDADAALFSFGPIKTATALGGALARVRDPALRERMRKIQTAWPIHGRGAFARRALAFAALKLLTSRPLFAVVARAFLLSGRDYEDPVADAARGIAPLATEAQLRLQPGAPMLALLARRLARFDRDRAAARAGAGRALYERLAGCAPCPAARNPHHAFWVFPVLVDAPEGVIEALRRRGFDAANLRRSAAVDPPADRPALEPAVARSALARLVVLPCYPEMAASELAREADALRAALVANAASGFGVCAHPD
jgi:dTDP-4-amino-4,6-dideoxygalactose transaminase